MSEIIIHTDTEEFSFSDAMNTGSYFFAEPDEPIVSYAVVADVAGWDVKVQRFTRRDNGGYVGTGMVLEKDAVKIDIVEWFEDITRAELWITGQKVAYTEKPVEIVNWILSEVQA